MSAPVAEVSARTARLGFSGLATASFLGCIDLTIVATALPSITREFGTSLGVSQLVLSGFLTALAMFMVTAGRLGDHFGRRPVLLGGLTVFIVASVAVALAPGIGWLIAARFVQGAACAVLYTGTSTLVEQLFGEGERGRAIGWLYAVNGIGLAIGPVLGGLLVPALGWSSVFWINVPLGIVALVLIVTAVPSPPPNPAAGLDIAGQVLLAITVAALVATVSLPESAGWLSAPVIIAAVLALVGAAALVLVERRVPEPLLRVDLFARPQLRAALTSDFFLAAFYAAALLVLPQYLSSARGLAEQAVGLSLLLVSATMALTSPRVGRFVDQRGYAVPLRVGFGALIVAAATTLISAQTHSLIVLLVGFVFFGFGWALILAPATIAALSAVSSADSGFAVGASWTFHNLGGALGAAIAAAVYTASPSDRGFTYVGVFLLVVAAAGLVANLVITPKSSAAAGA